MEILLIIIILILLTILGLVLYIIIKNKKQQTEKDKKDYIETLIANSDVSVDGKPLNKKDCNCEAKCNKL